MEKEFVPYEPSSELKELGFDEPCIAYWYNETPTNPEGQCLVYYKKPWDDEKIIKGIIREYYYAPLYQQAFRWFREKHSLRFSIIDDHSENEKPYSFTSEHEYYYDTGSGNNWFKTYEEAELECLKKLIELCRELK